MARDSRPHRRARRAPSGPRDRSATTKAPGTAPGARQYVGRIREQRPHLDVLHWTAETLSAAHDVKPDEAFSKVGQGVSWLNLSGIHDVDLTVRVGELAGLHALVLEDVLNTGQRPKLEDSKEHLFLVVRMLLADSSEGIIDEHVSLILGEGYVLSFQETPQDIFEPVRRRLQDPGGRLRQRGSDYLFYALLDALVDHYFVILQQIGDQIEWLEAGLLHDPAEDRLGELYELRSRTITLRRAVWPLRDAMHKLARLEHPLLSESTEIYLRDLDDHTVQVLEGAETHRELISTLVDLHMSGVSQRLNEVMKVLTLVATLFIPLTFIAGIYGMNFEYMPELAWRWGYFAALGAMIGLAAAMLYYFRRKQWI